MSSIRPVYIIGGARTPFTKSMTNYMGVSTQDLMTAALTSLVEQFQLKGRTVGDVAFGAIMQNPKDWNLTRECVLGSGLHPHTPGYNVQRACGTGLETSWQIANKIALGHISNGISGGVDTNSDLPITVSKGLKKILLQLNSARSLQARLKILSQLRPKDLMPALPAVSEPRTGMSMGQHCEQMVKHWSVGRKEQDELALASHHRAAKAWQDGFHKDLVTPFNGLVQDTIVRGDTSLEKLAKLKPAFDFTGAGTLTAGNSSPLTDGASSVLLASEESAKANSWEPQARFVDCEVAALDYVGGDGLLMAPTIAVARMLTRQKLTLQDFDFYEIHEAFAGQVLCTLKAWEDEKWSKRLLQSPPLGSIDLSKLNVHGSSLAIGHPFAATGGRIVASLAKTLKTSGKKRGLISICTAGGMGVAAILESV
tara:strand:+ start:3589 stop:4863 length:1275 start_codon:yes stop_codon:yes gene_type:complete